MMSATPRSLTGESRSSNRYVPMATDTIASTPKPERVGGGETAHPDRSAQQEGADDEQRDDGDSRPHPGEADGDFHERPTDCERHRRGDHRAPHGSRESCVCLAIRDGRHPQACPPIGGSCFRETLESGVLP